MVYRGADGHLAWLPTHWTNVGEEDPFLIVSGGRSHFRAGDLIDLAVLVATLQATKAVHDV